MEIRLLTILAWLLVTTVCLALGACAVFNQPRFGKLPQGTRLERITQSPNYRDDEFQYPIPTPLFSQDTSTLSVIWHNFFSKSERLIPDSSILAIKTDLKALYPQQDVVIWLGHSSWFIQLGGKRILIDPVFSEYAAPFSFINKAFEGTSIYRTEDMPEIDLLLISHDHWDHLDYPTAIALRPKVKQVICPLGVGAYFENWDYPKEKISEGDWFDSVEIEKDFRVHVLPARHYSGRLLSKNKTLWAGFSLQAAQRNIFFSGDSGYGPHFSAIGKAFQGFDIVLLDCGQYDPRWSYIHMTPEEASQAARDLGGHALMPAHVGKFTIANHPWDEPFKRLADANQNRPYRLVMPKIGESVIMNAPFSHFPGWWLEMDQSQIAALNAK